MNILYTLNDGFVPQVAAGICSVCENNKTEDEIVFFLFSSLISEKNKRHLKDLAEEYNRTIKIIEIGNVEQWFDFEFDTSGWNPIVLSRLLLDKFLPNKIERVLYLDGDTIVRGSLRELWNTDMGEKYVGMVAEPTVDKKRRKALGLEKHLYFNAGVILVDLKKWRENHVESKLIGYYKKHCGRLFANDQDLLNIVLKTKIYALSPQYNYSNIFDYYPYGFLRNLAFPAEYISKRTYEKARKNPLIIHFLGEERPWRNGNRHKYKSDYIMYLNMTYWKDTPMEKGWELYFKCWNIFNLFTKPFPIIRYTIINSLIPVMMKIRARKRTNNE